MKNIKSSTRICILVVAIIMLTQIQNIKAQIPPVLDPAWILRPDSSEEFNSLGLDTVNKWWIANDRISNSGMQIDYRSNVTFTDTTMKIKADTLPFPVTIGSKTYYYRGGLVASINWDYQFGYLEMRAKSPAGEYAWPNFWLWSNSCPTPTYYNEIDIMEQGGGDAFDGHTMATNWHLYNGTPDCANPDPLLTSNFFHIENLPRLDSAFHKYAIEWNKEGMIWYFDDVPVRTELSPNTPTHRMAIIFGNGVDTIVKPLGDKFDPCFLEVDYMRYYKLKTKCNDTLHICNPGTDYSLHAVQKSIKTGGTGGCSPTFNTSDKYTLRATDFVILDVGTEIIPDGSGQFTIQILQCPE